MKKLVSLFLTFVFVLSGCSGSQSSLPADSQSELSSETEQTQDEYLVLDGNGFTIYKGIDTTYIETDGNGRTYYSFVANYKSGEHRIEIYYNMSVSTGDYIILHMTDGKITGVMHFTANDMYNTFGRWNLINADTNEKLTIGSIYCQCSGATINYDFMSGTVTVDRHRIAHIGDDYQPRATRQDGLYTIYGYYPADLGESGTWLRDNTTGDMTQLSDSSPDVTGFMADGNLYMMDSGDYREMAVDGSLLYALSDNFPTGLVDEEKGIVRDIRGVYKDVNHGRYYVMYYDCDKWEYVPDTTLLQATYRLAVLDENGVAKQIIETGKYVETSKNHAVELSVRAVNEHTISFYREEYNSLQFEVFVDLNTEAITLLDYRQWNQ